MIYLKKRFRKIMVKLSCVVLNVFLVWVEHVVPNLVHNKHINKHNKHTTKHNRHSNQHNKHTNKHYDKHNNTMNY